MSVGDLESAAKAYADKIQSKQSEAEKIKSQLSSLSPQEIFGDKGKAIKDEAAKLGSEIALLTERYQIYVQKYQSLGGDMAKVQVNP